MKKEEGKYKKELCSYLDLLGCHCHVTHGNQYQSGMPDVHITTPNGPFLFVETKFWSLVKSPDRNSVVAQLDGAQISVITAQHWPRCAPSFILSFIGSDPNYAALVYKDNFTVKAWKRIAREIVRYETLSKFLEMVYV